MRTIYRLDFSIARADVAGVFALCVRPQAERLDLGSRFLNE